MSDEQAVLTASFKAGTGYEGPLVVVRAERPADMEALLAALRADTKENG